jgi:hypothetical protein
MDKYLNRIYVIGENLPNNMSYEAITEIVIKMRDEAKIKDNIDIPFDKLSEKIAEGFNKIYTNI